MWHDRIFYPNSINIPDQYQRYYKQWQPSLLNDLRYLKAHYPNYPTVEDFRQSILSSADFGTKPEHHLYIVSQLALHLPRLEAAGALLPDLIKFYCWLHTEGAYKVEEEYAFNNGYKEFIAEGDAKYPEMELKSMFENIRVAYNKYVTLVGRSVGAGACANLKRHNRLYEITDQTPIISLLSVGDDPEQGYDWLYIVMKDIIDFHNDLIDEFVQALPHAHVQHLPTDSQSPSSILPVEVDNYACIIPTSSNPWSSIQLQLIRSRCTCMAGRDGSTLRFDLESLQRDMIIAFILGKSKINTDNLRKPFMFREKKPDALMLDMSVLDLSTIDHYIGVKFKVDLDNAQKKELDCQFHSLDYHKLMKLVTGLRIAMDHLIKAIHLPDNAQDENQLMQQTIMDFLQIVYQGQKHTQSEGKDVMHFFGFHQLSQSQLHWLSSCKLPHLYKTYEFFLTWVNDGMYDFHHLPYLMKRSLSESQRTAIQKIPHELPFKDDPVALAEEIKAFEEVLLHNEDNMRKGISTTEVPLIQHLQQLQFIPESDHLPQFIPGDVMCQQYVAMRIALRRLLATVQQDSGSTFSKEWSDCVEDLWLENNLKHLRDVAIPFEKEPPVFEYDPLSGRFGYQEGDEEGENGENEEFGFIHTGPADEPSLPTVPEPSTSTNGEHVSAPTPLPQQKSYESQMPENQLFAADTLQQVHEAPSRLQQAFIKSLKPFIRRAVRCNTPALGQGSFGSVCTFLMGDTIVAGKIYRLPYPNDIESYVQHFSAMFNILFKLQHENIVSYRGVCFLPREEYPILLMEHLKCSLQTYLEQSSCPDLKEVISMKLRILRDVANGLNYLHKRDPAIVHRDLTASNILLDECYTAKIADFGHAKLINLGPGALSMTMTAMGNGFYMPPEASEMKYDEKIDIFSFGHLSIFTITQEAIKMLPGHVKCDAGKSVPVSEVERRQEHISNVSSIVGENHFIIAVICKCLSDFPQDRPSASKILEKLDERVMDITELNEVSSYLQCLNRDQLTTLGLVLGLHYNTLQMNRQASDVEYRNEMLAAWLRQQDSVIAKMLPTWKNLVKALRDDQLCQNGIATQIEKNKGLQ